jgi:hypothetical protein
VEGEIVSKDCGHRCRHGLVDVPGGQRRAKTLLAVLAFDEDDAQGRGIYGGRSRLGEIDGFLE